MVPFGWPWQWLFVVSADRGSSDVLWHTGFGFGLFVWKIISKTHQHSLASSTYQYCRLW